MNSDSHRCHGKFPLCLILCRFIVLYTLDLLSECSIFSTCSDYIRPSGGRTEFLKVGTKMADLSQHIQFRDEIKPVRSNRSNGLAFGDVLAESKVSQMASSYDFEEKALEIANEDLNKKKKQVCI